MKLASALAVSLAAALSLATAGLAVRVARHVPGARLELGRARLTRLTGATLRRLDSLQDSVFLTYFVSDRSRMPSHLRHVESSVTDLLEALRAASRGKVDFQIVDPDTDPDLVKYAARRGVAPFRARSVERDAWSEQTVWSTLTISFGPRRDVAINGIGPEHLERLQGLVVENLDAMESPRKPVIAIAAPETGYQVLRSALTGVDRPDKKEADVVRASLSGRVSIPPEADVLFWMDPGPVGEEQLRALDHWIARGRSVVIAGSSRRVELTTVEGRPAAVFRASDYGAEDLFAHFGLRAVPGVVLDERSETIAGPAGASPGEGAPAPFAVRCIALDQDWRTLRGQPNGNLLFVAPTPMTLDGEALAARGLAGDVLATSSDKTWIQEVAPGTPVALADLARDRGEPVAKQPLVVRVHPRDPWRGSVYFFASSSPFQDGLYDREAVAHPRLLRTLLENTTSVDRLVIHRAGVIESEPIPPLGPAERLLWRGLAVFLLPALLVALALARGAFAGGRAAREDRIPLAGWMLAGAVLAILAAAVVARGAATIRVNADLSEEGASSLAPETRAIAARATGAGAVEAELLFSRAEKLSPAMRPWAKAILDRLAGLRSAGADLVIRRTDPDDLGDARRAALEALGVTPFQVATQDEEVTTVRTVHASLRLSARGRTEVLRFRDASSMEALEFRLAFALWRLETGKRPVVVFASDVPRPSPAEAYDDFQAGLTAPSGTDVYAVARRVLESLDFAPVHVNPREPRFPESPDLVVWIQPRRDVSKTYDWLARHLYQGGSAILAAQHYNVQARQYRGRGFDVVYWPQPQFNDVNHLYLPDLGILLDPEVLFDDVKTKMAAQTQVNRIGPRPEIDMQTSALPFVVRAVAAHFAPDSTVTRGLGDQAFVWSSFWSLDAAKLASLGLRVTPLITTSARTWSYPWKGGWIPPELLEGAPKGEDGAPQWRGKLPLVVLVEGQFPWPPAPIQLKQGGMIGPDGAELPPPEPPPESRPDRAASPGKALLLACSEMWKNHRIFDAEFRADHLLVNSVATMALPPDLAAVAAKRPVSRGFDFVEPVERQRWRAAVLGGFPALILLFGAVRWIVRRAPPRRAAAPDGERAA